MSTAPAAAFQPSVVSASLLSPQRKAAMARLLRENFNGPIRVLEVGVWQAAGSTQVWLENLPAGSELVLIDAWQPYASEQDMDGQGHAPSSWNYAAMDAECEAAFDIACDRIRTYERARPEHLRVAVHLLRAPASQALSWMRDGAFDLVYVDGDHKYAQVKSDLLHARRLVNHNRGVICGDDLERLPDQATLALAREHPQRDYLGAPHRFHPGVCRAVHECFGTVRMTDGFWWVHSHEGHFLTDLPAPTAETQP